MKWNLEAIIKKYTNEDGVIDYASINKAVVGQSNEAIKKAAEENSGVLAENLIKELGIDGVTNMGGLKAHLEANNQNHDTLNQEMVKLKNVLSGREEENKKIIERNQELEHNNSLIQHKETLTTLGFNSDQMNNVLPIISSQVSENKSFELAAKEFMGNPQNAWAVGKSGGSIGGSGNDGKEDDTLDAELENRYGIKMTD